MPPESRQDSKGRLGRFLLLLNKTDQNIEILFSRCKMCWIVWIAVTLVGINAVCGQEGAIEFKYTKCCPEHQVKKIRLINVSYV